MKMSGGIAPPFLIPALGGRELSASRSCRFIPWEKALSTHWIGGWVGPGASLDLAKILPLLGIESWRPAHSLSLYRLSYPGF
jgi:hypothetical protein